MKRVCIAAALPLLIILLSQCCKSRNSPSLSIPGVWKGNFGFPDEPLNNYFCIRLKSDGVVQELDEKGEVIGEGKWIQAGDSLKATYSMFHAPFNQYSVAGFIAGAGMYFKGSWGYAGNAFDGGPFELKKVQQERYHR